MTDFIKLKPISELPTEQSPLDGQILFSENDDLKKYPLKDLRDMVSVGVIGSVAPTDTTPNVNGGYKPTISGTYANCGGLVAQPNYDTIFFLKDGVWTKSEVEFASTSLADDTEFKSKTDSKAFSPEQLFENVIGDFNFPSSTVNIDMAKPEPTFAISKANQFLPITHYWSPADSLYADMQFITSIDLYFREISSSFNVYVFDRNDLSAPAQTISVSPPAAVGQKTHTFATPINNATHKICVQNGMSFYEYSGASATENIKDGVISQSPGVILGVNLHGYKFDSAGSKKIVERLDSLDAKTYDGDVIKVYKGSSEFSSITSALNSIKNLTGKKTINVYEGTYEETIDLYAINQNLTVQIIGIGTGVKVLKRTGDYYAPPMQVNCNAYFENITFESTEELNLQSLGAYAVHTDVNIDQNTNPNYPCTIEFFRCKFISELQSNQGSFIAAYGSGSWQGANLIFRNCFFNKKNTLNGGAMYWHNAVANAKNQRLEMHFCEVYSNGGPTLQLHDANQTNGGNSDITLSEAKVLFIGNTFYSGDTPVNNSVRLQENVRTAGALVGNIFLDERSHGNNITILNA